MVPNVSKSKVQRAIDLSAEKYCSASILMKRAGVKVSHDFTIEDAPTSVHDMERTTEKVQQPPLTLGLHHVALLSSKYEQTRNFYTHFMQMTVEWEPDEDNVYLTTGTDNLAIHRKADHSPHNQGSLDHIGFIVADPDHVDAWHDYLAKNDIRTEAPPKTHRDGARSCYVLDPDGTKVQIIYHPPLSDKSA